MTIIRLKRTIGGAICAAGVIALLALPAIARPKGPVALKEAKFIIEHNATDHDTGFQGAVDSEGWDRLDLIGPKGAVLHFEGKGALGELGLTELFFETVEPENANVPIEELLQDIPAGTYTYRGHVMIDGESSGETEGTATLSHTIPKGPELLYPAKGASVGLDGLVMKWGAVTQSLEGKPVNIIGYQLIVERTGDPHPKMIGKWGLSMYLPPSILSMAIPRAFLEPHTKYAWEVLAIDESGNQTLSSGEFATE